MIELQPWSEENLSLLEELNTPEMTRFLGGSESKEQLLRRHTRYLEAAEASTVRVFKITYGSNLLPVGQVCYWERSWHDQLVWESGWGVLPAYQGQGVASQAITLLLERARSEHKHRFLHAFPSVKNEASNALCRKLGFTKIEECDFEYPPGKLMRCNDWQIDLFNGHGSGSNLPDKLAQPIRRALTAAGIQYLESEPVSARQSSKTTLCCRMHLNNCTWRSRLKACPSLPGNKEME